MITYNDRYGDRNDDNYIIFDTREEAIKSLEKRIMSEKSEPIWNHRLYAIIYDEKITEEFYESYQNKMSRETKKDIEDKAGIKVMSYGWLTVGKPVYYWIERWEYEGDLFSRW